MKHDTNAVRRVYTLCLRLLRDEAAARMLCAEALRADEPLRAAVQLCLARETREGSFTVAGTEGAILALPFRQRLALLLIDRYGIPAETAALWAGISAAELIRLDYAARLALAKGTL